VKVEFPIKPPLSSSRDERQSTRRLGAVDVLPLFAAAIVVVFVVYVFLNASSYLGSARGIILYIGIPAVAFLAVAATLWQPRYVRRQIYLLGWSVVVALYAFEGYLFWQGSRLSTVPPGWDARSRLEVIRDLRRDGVDAFPSVTPKNFSDADLDIEIEGQNVVPLGGVPGATVVHCNESGQWSVYATDRFGFPNPDPIWDAGVDVALIGDSYVQGACVQPDQTIAGNLRRVGLRVLNLGAQGNGPLSELATIREYAALKRPGAVVWFFYYNDLQQDFFREMSDPVISSYLDPSFRQGLAKAAGEIREQMPPLVLDVYERALTEGRRIAMAGAPGNERVIARDQAHFRRSNPLSSLRFFTLSRTRERLGLFQAGADFRPPDEERFRKVLFQASQEVAAWGGQLYFVALPSWARAMGEADSLEDVSHEAGVRVASEVGLDTIDLTRLFNGSNDPTELFANQQPNHYSVLGYSMVAGAIAKRWLRRESR
jgi:hypothetical protein